MIGTIADADNDDQMHTAPIEISNGSEPRAIVRTQSATCHCLIVRATTNVVVIVLGILCRRDAGVSSGCRGVGVSWCRGAATTRPRTLFEFFFFYKKGQRARGRGRAREGTPRVIRRRGGSPPSTCPR